MTNETLKHVNARSAQELVGLKSAHDNIAKFILNKARTFVQDETVGLDQRFDVLMGYRSMIKMNTYICHGMITPLEELDVEAVDYWGKYSPITLADVLEIIHDKRENWEEDDHYSVEDCDRVEEEIKRYCVDNFVVGCYLNW